MPQEFQVLRCYSCGTFQVHQVKKVLKYNCKVCGEKQSIKKVYGRGTGADCRKHVQKCNMLRCELDMATEEKLENLQNDRERPATSAGFSSVQASGEEPRGPNKWEDFLDHPEEGVGDNDMEDEQYTTSRQQFISVKRDNSKAARERWKSWRQQKSGRYNNQKRSAGEASQEPGLSDEQYSSYQTVQTNAKQANEMQKMFTPCLMPSESNTTRNTYHRQGTADSGFHGSHGNNTAFALSRSTETSLGVTGHGSTKNNPSVTVKNRENLISAVSTSFSDKGGSSKLLNNRKASNEASNPAQGQSRWSAFLGMDNKDEESDDSDDDQENEPAFFRNRNFQSNLSVASNHGYNFDVDEVLKNEHFETQNDAPKYGVQGKLGGQAGKNNFSDSGKVSVDYGRQGNGQKHIFNVDNDLENILDEDW